MDPWQVIIAVAAVLGGIVLNGSVGFGAGLFAIPLMVMADIALPMAVGLTGAAALVQAGFNSVQYRAHTPWRAVAGITLGRLLFLPVGVGLLVGLAAFPQTRVKQIVGGVLVVVLATQWLMRIKPRPRLHWGWGLLAGPLSGAMGGALGMGGPPLVLWVMAHDWPSRRSRAFLYTTFALALPLQLMAIAAWLGEPVIDAIGLGLIVSPLMMVGARLGSALGERLNRNRLRLAALLLLLALAISAIVGPLLQRGSP